MYEEITYDVILNEMLNSVKENYPSLDTREESVIGIAIAPVAAELAQAYIDLDVILNETFADTASREYLVRRAAERGIEPYPTTFAVCKGEFNKDITIGDRFTLNGMNYVAIERISTGIYKLQCETAGCVPNGNTGSLIPIDYIDSLEKANLTEVLIPGEDEEDTESLRSRYFSSLISQSFGGNIADYKEKVNGLSGIGGVKVYSTWNGGGTVKLVIIDSSYTKASDELVKEVQEKIDPVGNQGQGYGIAPIGHVVTVESVVEATINIATTITYQPGYTFAEINSYINSYIDAYFQDLRKSWADNDGLVVRISQLEYRLLNVTGIVDISGTMINGVEENLILEKNAIPIRGDVIG
ncbi:MAG TPA: baseplate J/gp47 family protein [Lachnospiraceae bacterium]|nr:baseplate J/gp47 family protein [Lachnospiraceae bacterium]